MPRIEFFEKEHELRSKVFDENGRVSVKVEKIPRLHFKFYTGKYDAKPDNTIVERVLDGIVDDDIEKQHAEALAAYRAKPKAEPVKESQEKPKKKAKDEKDA